MLDPLLLQRCSTPSYKRLERGALRRQRVDRGLHFGGAFAFFCDDVGRRFRNEPCVAEFALDPAEFLPTFRDLLVEP